MTKRWIIRGALLALILAAAYAGWRFLRGDGLEGIAAGNGRVEATEIDIAAKTPGRIRTMLVDEGDEVKAGQVLATIDTDALNAQRDQARAQFAAARAAIESARLQVAQATSQRAAAVAQMRQRQADLTVSRQHLARSSTLAGEGATPRQEAEDDRARLDAAQAATDAADAQIRVADAAIATARSQVVGAGANADAARATIQRLDADIADGVLRAPRDGRIQYRIAQPGEVVGAGGRVLDMIDLGDVTMTFFLPEAAAGKVALGSEVRIVLDSAPDRVVPARVSFVADVAQFTPKTVETQDERQKLMFRVKARIDRAYVARHRAVVKSGMPGMAYVRIDGGRPWPAKLALTQPR